ncbi:hypothetical protein ADICYQ_3400 [Cyclobacterium qasimii M12-11B]|uniref:Uncharacterized protein n=1 Tax=Cyclobacterium qasimii M12-11B TaxID=641524 RepID=S7VDH6_9BACT|nr:hypothetical protein ADICYQ_3400 [Cyclobacterium qasimii M12-11B]
MGNVNQNQPQIPFAFLPRRDSKPQKHKVILTVFWIVPPSQHSEMPR